MAPIEFVKENLPTPWLRRVASLTVSLAGLISILPQWWQSVLGQDPTEQPELLIRLFLLSTILFLGSSITLCLVIMEYRAQAKKLKETQTALGDCVRQNIEYFNANKSNIPFTASFPDQTQAKHVGLLG